LGMRRHHSLLTQLSPQRRERRPQPRLDGS
jgi:hypothetical protein